MDMSGAADLVKEIKLVGENIINGDVKTNKRIDGIEESVNALLRKANRPGAEARDDATLERKSASEMCLIRRHLTVPKNDGGTTADYTPSPSEIDDALLARKAVKALFRHGDTLRLDATEKKSLTSFALGSNGFILPPEMSNQVISCITDPSDVVGLMNNVTTSAGSLKFLIDNARMQDSAWACQANCFANNPTADLTEGLGEMEIRAEPLRHVACAGSDLIQDSSFNIEAWVLGKVAQGFRNTINNAIIGGDGVGKPLGILSPNGGVPIMDTAPATPLGTFTWQDLVMLKWDVPVQFHTQGGAYLMNQRVFAQLLTMSDAIGRPIMIANPTEAGQFLINGSPVVIATQMPDVEPGNTPVAFGGWKAAYTVVTRRATTMLTDPFSAGWCVLFKFDARVGGAPTCPNAARLLRIR